jgi:hypothetical protein
MTEVIPMPQQAPRSSAASGAAAFALLAVLAGPADAATNPRDPLNGRSSYSGSSMTCLIANDFYMVHFSALQEGRKAGESTDFVKYCQEVPTLGKVYLTIDLLDRDVRNTPIALSVVEENIGADGRPAGTKRVMAEVPARIYKSGTADTHVEITEPGHYALIATIGEEPVMEDDRLRVPFSVGLPPPTDYGQYAGKLTGALTALFFGVMGVIGYRTWRSYRPKRAGEAPAHSGAKAG